MSEKETKKQEQYTHLYKMESYGPLDSPKNHKDQPTLYLWKGQHLSTDTECWTNRIFVCGGGGGEMIFSFLIIPSKGEQSKFCHHSGEK